MFKPNASNQGASHEGGITVIRGVSPEVMQD